MALDSLKSFAKKIIHAFHLEEQVRKVIHSLQSRSQTQEWKWPSETSKCRDRLAPFCTGNGVDLGFGGDPIVEYAVRVDQPQPYAKVGDYPVQLGGSADNLYWFRDGVLDFVFSSHLLEDFEDTEKVLREWLRVLKAGGKLILYCPDEQRFRAHCKATGQPCNPAHKHEYFSLSSVKDILIQLGEDNFLEENAQVDIYSWELICVKKN